MNQRPKVYVLVGPSGSGKSMLMDMVLKWNPEFCTVKTLTTRSPRKEAEPNYEFVSEQEFQEMIDREELLEWSVYAGHFYGTAKYAISNVLASGKFVIKALDAEGARQVKMYYPDNCKLLFVYRNYQDLVSCIMKRDVSEEDKKRRIDSLNQEVLNCMLCDAVLLNVLTPDALYQEFLQNL